MSFPYGAVPLSLRAILGEEGYQYLQRLHEHIAGVGADGKGSLGARALGLSPSEQSVLFVGSDGAVSAQPPKLSHFKADGAGVVAADAEGNLSPGPLASNSAPRRALRYTASGLTFDDTLDTEVPGVATLVDPGTTPDAADADTKIRTYARNGYLVHQHTFMENKVLDPTSKLEVPVPRTIYKWLNMRDNQDKYVQSDQDPSVAPETKGKVVGGVNNSLSIAPATISPDVLAAEVFS